MRRSQQSLKNTAQRIALLAALCASPVAAQTIERPNWLSNVPSDFQFSTPPGGPASIVTPPPPLSELQRSERHRYTADKQRPTSQSVHWTGFPRLSSSGLTDVTPPRLESDLSTGHEAVPSSPFQRGAAMQLVSGTLNASPPNSQSPTFSEQQVAKPTAVTTDQPDNALDGKAATSRATAKPLPSPAAGQASVVLLPPTPLPVVPSTPRDEQVYSPGILARPTSYTLPKSENTAAHEADNPSPSIGPQYNREESIATRDGEQVAATKSAAPSFFFPPLHAVQTDSYGCPAAFNGNDFLAAPFNPLPADPHTESLIYRGKFPVPVQRPWVEWWRPLYTGGIYPPAPTWLGETNLLMPHFMVYGDYRTGVGVHQVAQGPSRSYASRLNLDMDLKLTATERFHAFMGPLDRTGDISRIDFSDSRNIEFVDRTDLRLDTGFFEGDVGAILGGMQGIDSPFDLPFTVGLVPLLYQNGIWMEDAMIGGAFAVPAKNSPVLEWSNFDATFFAASDQVTSDAFAGDNNAAQILGTAWFIDAYEGFIEADYAFVHDRVGGDRSYHNASIAFTRRYLTYVSNSIRFISNSGQSLPSEQRTADGYLILLENSLISSQPDTFVPYANFFYGSGRPQSVARAAGSGGVLRNTGINFETDGLTNYPTLDATANNSYGAAVGVNILGSNFSEQLVLELAALGVTGSSQFRSTAGEQYAAGVRYQRPLSHRWIFRADSMYGWLHNNEDVFGNRIEFRWKF